MELGAEPERHRLGIFVENVYFVERTGGPRRVFCGSIVFAFALFAAEVGRHFRSVTFFGRTRRDQRDDFHPLPEHVALVELPFYTDVTRIGEQARAALGAAPAIWRGLKEIDVVWVLGPHPFSFLVLALAFARRKRIVLGVRQDTVRYYRSRLRSPRWRLAMPVVWAMHGLFRMLSQRLPTVAVGPSLARLYGGDSGRALPITVTLVRLADVATAPAELDRLDSVNLLTVARIEPEKNPLLLVEALAELEKAEPGRFRLTWAGEGRLTAALRARAEELGVLDRLELPGYVPFGPELLALYRRSDIFVHVALTEGLPQALLEALATATAVVATDVGGVAQALDGGAAGLLVPPSDRRRLVRAIAALADDPALRRALVIKGLELARATTLDSEAERVARFIARA